MTKRKLTKHEDDIRRGLRQPERFDISPKADCLEVEVTRLKTDVERLTKAGDAMASSIQFNEEMDQDYNGPTIVHQSVQRWNDAKEGKPK